MHSYLPGMQALPDVRHDGNVALLRSAGGPCQLLNCITSEMWTLPAGQWSLTALASGEVQLRNEITGGSKSTKDLFMIKILQDEGGLKVLDTRDGALQDLANYLREMHVRYDTIHTGVGQSLPIKVYVLARASRGARCFWELVDLAKALGCWEKKGQEGRRWLYNSFAAWRKTFEALGQRCL